MNTVGSHPLKIVRSVITLLVSLGATSLYAATALVGATVHPVTSPPIEQGVVVVEDGLIRAVGGDNLINDTMQTIDLGGKHVYPGLIAAYTHLGLMEIETVRATIDLRETGQLNPNATAHKAFTPDSELIPVTRSNGVLLALAAPSGGRISGKSSLMQLAGWTWEDMLVEPDVALQIEWPRTRSNRRGGAERSERSNTRDAIDELDELFDRAQAYAAERAADASAQEDDLRLEAMLPFVTGKRPVMVAARGQAEIEAAVAFFTSRGMQMIVLGGYEADRCASLLVENNVPVILTGVYRNPGRRHRAYDGPYNLPARLHEAGVTYCIAGSSNDLDWNTRNLPYHAATAVGFGLPHDEALRSITINAARILGVDDRLGSLETGKQATLIVTDGDPLEITTHVERAFVRGQEIDLTDRHRQLRDKYQQRIDGR